MTTKKKKNPVGRPSKYKEEYCEQLIEWFDKPSVNKEYVTVVSAGKELNVQDDVAPEIPTLTRFANHIGVNDDTLKEWRDTHPKFSVAYKKAKKLQEALIVENGMKGRYNTTFALFMLKCNHGWKEQEKQDSQNINITIDAKDEQL